MSQIVFSEDVLAYIEAHIQSDPIALLLKKSPFSEIEMSTIVQQIRGKQIAAKKFPFLLPFSQYIYPVKISLEQASSQQTAEYKSQLIDGHSFADLTGGMGIDTYILGSNFHDKIYVEPNTELYNNAVHNFKVLEFININCIQDTCENFLQDYKDKIDWIYLDPSRRIEGDKKTSIHNYEPNVVDLKDLLLKTAHNILIKLSPMQDISECIDSLENVNNVWVISINNEVKELLIHLGKDKCENPIVSAVDISKSKVSSYSSSFSQRLGSIETEKVKKYIYQPFASTVKSALHNSQALDFELKKIHPNTQLFTADELFKSYPGRKFEVIVECKVSKKEIAQYLPSGKANVITKNFPLSPNQLKSKLKIKDGGDDYILAYTNFQEDKRLAICKRLEKTS